MSSNAHTKWVGIPIYSRRRYAHNQTALEKTMKFLVIEDDARVRRMIVSIVADASDSVYECSDGAEARASYARHLPDWVLMDLMMPHVNGIAATHHIKSLYPAAKIIIVTSHESQVMRETAREAGAFAYVLKENLLDLRGLIERNTNFNSQSK